jgi:hypothetical protein
MKVCISLITDLKVLGVNVIKELLFSLLEVTFFALQTEFLYSKFNCEIKARLSKIVGYSF